MRSAHTALGNYELAWEDLSTVSTEMDRQTVIHDWYCRLPLESGLTELWLAKGDLVQARSQADQLLITQATAERTWQALVWEASARVAIAELDLEKARDCITQRACCAWRVARFH
jgi:hypothetical protein